ncbi:hypothetical protein CEXT_195281 [Caerostris extrusa]|uniref:Uncharacterized protein n=1 Tax=Caerostris extrusa TaxID=172846 RepID=A0AAV4NU83_CAEEX|nr:hypothetical protein CEXT_195281 [Caerostris extrusa]
MDYPLWIYEMLRKIPQSVQAMHRSTLNNRTVEITVTHVSNSNLFERQASARRLITDDARIIIIVTIDTASCELHLRPYGQWKFAQKGLMFVSVGGIHSNRCFQNCLGIPQ